MKNPSDSVGNELCEGALVGVMMDVKNPLLIGRIKHLSTGGIDLASMDSNKQAKTAGLMVVQIDVPIPFVPESRLTGIYRVIDPAMQETIEAIAKDEQKKLTVIPGVTK